MEYINQLRSDLWQAHREHAQLKEKMRALVPALNTARAKLNLKPIGYVETFEELEVALMQVFDSIEAALTPAPAINMSLSFIESNLTPEDLKLELERALAQAAALAVELPARVESGGGGASIEADELPEQLESVEADEQQIAIDANHAKELASKLAGAFEEYDRHIEPEESEDLAFALLTIRNQPSCCFGYVSQVLFDESLPIRPHKATAEILPLIVACYPRYLEVHGQLTDQQKRDELEGVEADELPARVVEAPAVELPEPLEGVEADEH